MSEMIARLNNYLSDGKARLVGASSCHVAIGNEAADLDSMASAIMYGLFAAAEPGDSRVVLTVVNIPREDFILRTEATYLFRRLGIDETALVFADEIDLDALHREGRLRLTLVDHNTLAADKSDLADAVAAIVDHHDDAGAYPWADPRLIEPVGSAATLVAGAVLDRRPELIDSGTATLLLGTILLDTVNLDAGAGRVTAKDRGVAARLGAAAEVDRNALFAELQAEKFTISGLSTQDLLRKDYKQWQAGGVDYGISTVLTSLENWVSADPDMLARCEGFRRARGLGCLLAMMAYTDEAGTFRRELAVFAQDEALRRRIVDGLSASDIGLGWPEPHGPAAGEKACLFTQADASASRKKVQPLLDDLLAGP